MPAWRARQCGAMLLALAATLFAAPENVADTGSGELERLQAELQEAREARDPGRLRAAYGRIARHRPADPEIQRGLGLACYLSGHFDEAVSALESAKRLRPDLPGVRLYLGMSYLRTNRFVEALEEIERSPELDAGYGVARFWQGAAYRALGRLDPAIASLELASNSTDSTAEHRELLVRAYTERSSELFQRLQQAAPESGWTRLLRAEELVLDGVDGAAMKELDAALASDPQLPGAHLLRGRILWSREEYEGGARAFESELDADPLSAEARIRLGGYRLDQSRPDKAMPHLLVAQRVNPEDARIGELLEAAIRMGADAEPREDTPTVAGPMEPGLAAARVAYRQGRPDRAASLLEPVLAEQPGSLEPLRLLARCRLAENRRHDATRLLTAILNREPDDPEALYTLGRNYEALASESSQRLFELEPNSVSAKLLHGESFERGPRPELDKALAAFQEAAMIDPENPEALHAAGRALFQLQRFDQAARQFEQALERDSRHGMANYYLGRIELLRGNRSAAIERLSAALEARPALANARRDLARALVLDGRIEEGIREYHDLLQQDPADASVHALLATAYRAAGRIEQATEHADKARELAAAKHLRGQR